MSQLRPVHKKGLDIVSINIVFLCGGKRADELPDGTQFPPPILNCQSVHLYDQTIYSVCILNMT